jgi:hypothetical protein
MLVGAITAQQVSLFAAVAIRNRLVERFGERVGRVWAFPTRDRLAAASEEELFALGFSRRKAEYVVGLARSDVDLVGLAPLPDEEVAAQLTGLRGLGEWTADWFLARYLGRPRAWPAGDLALRKAVRALYGDVDVRATGARFEPFQNLTAHYLLVPVSDAVIRPRPPKICRSSASSGRRSTRRSRRSRGARTTSPRTLLGSSTRSATRSSCSLARTASRSRNARGSGSASSTSVYIRPEARRSGLAAQLVREVAAQDA